MIIPTGYLDGRDWHALATELHECVLALDAIIGQLSKCKPQPRNYIDAIGRFETDCEESDRRLARLMEIRQLYADERDVFLDFSLNRKPTQRGVTP